MSMISQSLAPIASTFKALDKNVQRVLLLGMVFLLYFVVDTYAIQPLTTDYEKLNKDIESTISARKRLEKEMQLMSKQLGVDPGLSDAQQLESLKAQLIELNERLKRSSSNFITADEMVNFLNETLVNGNRLKLLSLEKLPVEFTVVKSLENKKPGKGKLIPGADDVISEAKVYRHGVEFQLSGRYADLVSYMQTLENMSWRIFWESSDLYSDDYPNSIATFTIYTLSLDQNWLTL